MASASEGSIDIKGYRGSTSASSYLCLPPATFLPLPPATLIIVEPLELSFLIVSYSVLVRARVWGNSGWKIVFPDVRLITDVGIG